MLGFKVHRALREPYSPAPAAFSHGEDRSPTKGLLIAQPLKELPKSILTTRQGHLAHIKHENDYVRVPFARAKCLHFQMANPFQEQMYDNTGLAVLRAMETVLQAAIMKQVITLLKPASVHN